MAPPLLTLSNIALTFGGTPLLVSAGFSVAAGDRICLVGRNGSGKSTLLKIAAGEVQADTGERFVHPNARVCYLPQEADFSGYETALSYVEAGLGPADDPYQAQYLLNELGLTGSEDPQRLSGGEARRAALARLLAAKPDVMLLDEPTNHLDLDAIEWLEERLNGLRSAVVLVSHDRRFLQNLSQSIVWLDRGETRRLEAGFGAFEDWRDKILDEEDTAFHKLDRKIVRENQWMHGGVTARRKRNVRRVRELDALRKTLRERRTVQGKARLEASEGALSGQLIAEAKDVSKTFGDKPVVANLSIRVMRGDRLGIAGANGAGKTTILKLLTGALEPDAGTIRLGTNLELIEIDQKRNELNPNWTLTDALTGGRGDQVVINGKARHVASYMKDFLFLPEQRLTPVAVLSGGERARLMLARAFAKRSNVLILDEPTNDLDIETLDLLQELLSDYAGTVLLVSHDRDFLDRVATSVLAPEGKGRWVEYAGGYSDMLAQRGAKPEIRKVNQEKSAPAPSVDEGRVPAPAGSTKLSFKDKHALETLPALVETLEAEIANLNAKLASGDLYARDRAAFDAATGRLSAAERERDAAESRWLELEDRRATLERKK